MIKTVLCSGAAIASYGEPGTLLALSGYPSMLDPESERGIAGSGPNRRRADLTAVDLD